MPNLKMMLIDMYVYGREDDIKVIIGLRQDEKVHLGLITQQVDKDAVVDDLEDLINNKE